MMSGVEDSTDDTIIQILSDKDSRKILESIRLQPKSTSQLCTECKIPPSTAYRKMQRLYDYRVIRRIGTINKAGKRESLYKSNSDLLERFLYH